MTRIIRSHALMICALLAMAGAAAAQPAQQPARHALAYVSSGTCLNSPMGFNAKLQPVNAGIAWTMAFSAVGSVDENGNVTEAGQSVDTASFGVGPRMHTPETNGYTATFSSTVKTNSDGSRTLESGPLNGTFTDGPNAGQSFTVSPGLTLAQWPGEHGLSIAATGGKPVVQTLLFANGTRFQRICTVTTVLTPKTQ
jgi:hypothetical protein